MDALHADNDGGTVNERCMATMFDGCPGAGYTVILQIGNFLLFALINVILLFFHEYVICYLFAKSDRTKIFRIKLNRCVLIAGIILSAVSPFLHLYYLIDAQNIYHRSDGFFVSLIVPVLAVLVELSLLINIGRTSASRSLASMIFYYGISLSAMMIQIRYYGLALINMSIGIAMILMFVMITKEQNHELENLIRSREETAERLEISTMLNRCVTELTPVTILIRQYRICLALSTTILMQTGHIFSELTLSARLHTILMSVPKSMSPDRLITCRKFH